MNNSFQFRLPASFMLMLFASVLMLSSCKEDEKPVVVAPTTMKVHFMPKWHNEDFHIEQVYNDNFGNRLRFDKFMSYVSTLTIVAEDGTEHLLRDFLLLDYANDNTFTFDLPEGKYTALNFALGIPEAYNKDQDPAQYPSSSPLSVAGSQGMFWTWNSGYIFSKLEGKCDTTGTEGAELLWPVAIHAGDDTSLRQFESAALMVDVKGGTEKEIWVKVQVDEILQRGGSNDIDLATDAITHTSNNEELATIFMDNYVNAISIVQ